MKRCSVPGCDRKHKARGLCHAHHMQQLRAARRAPRAVAIDTTRPRSSYEQRRALFALAESNPSPERYEAEKARILGGQA